MIYYRGQAQTPQYGKLRDPRYDQGDFVFTVGKNSTIAVQPSPSPIPTPTPVIQNSKSGEEVFWDEVTRLNSKSSYQSYLNEYPSGKYVSTARLRIQNIDAEAANSAKQAEAQKWAEAERGNTIESYRSYLNAYPNGEYRATANLRINDLTAKAESGKLRNPSKGMTMERSLGNGLSMKFMGIPSGSFMMGSPSNETERGSDEGPQRRVTISNGFWLSKYEVTQEEYEAVMGTNPSNFKGCPKCPVEQVSWEDAKAYITKLNAKNDGFIYSLPSEAEWEYAAGAGTTGAFGIGEGNSLSSNQANFDGNYPYGGAAKGKYLEKTTPVGSYQPNAFGLYDMHGNVWEWCEDIYSDSYANLSVDGSSNVSVGDSTKRVLRGGSWYNYGLSLRSAFRYWDSPANRGDDVGFRVAVRVR